LFVRPEADMRQDGLEDFIAEFRRMLPAQSATVQAIDRHDPLEQIVLKAIEEGFTEFVDRLGRAMEICLRRGV
jgi:hypothetical protein